MLERIFSFGFDVDSVFNCKFCSELKGWFWWDRWNHAETIDFKYVKEKKIYLKMNGILPVLHIKYSMIIKRNTHAPDSVRKCGDCEIFFEFSMTFSRILLILSTITTLKMFFSLSDLFVLILNADFWCWFERFKILRLNDSSFTFFRSFQFSAFKWLLWFFFSNLLLFDLKHSHFLKYVQPKKELSVFVFNDIHKRLFFYLSFLLSLWTIQKWIRS